MTETTNLSIRIDRDLKDEADRIFNALGMNLTTAITVFVRQVVRQKKIPFDISLNTGSDVTDVTMNPKIQLGFVKGSPLPESFFDPLPEEELQAWGL